MSIFDEGTGSISLGNSEGPGKYAEQIAADIVEKLVTKRWPKDLAIKLIAEALDAAYSDGFEDALADNTEDEGSFGD